MYYLTITANGSTTNVVDNLSFDEAHARKAGVEHQLHDEGFRYNKKLRCWQAGKQTRHITINEKE